jgi:hypothetical protein
LGSEFKAVSSFVISSVGRLNCHCNQKTAKNRHIKKKSLRPSAGIWNENQNFQAAALISSWAWAEVVNK